MPEDSELIDLKTVSSVSQIRENIRRFHVGLPGNLSRGQSLARQTKYWVFDPASEMFGPAKFVGFERMSFERYNSAVETYPTGARFDGSVTRAAIEQVCGLFVPNTLLTQRLLNWCVDALPADTVASVTTDKWSFVELEAETRYWALACDPEVYDAVSALRLLDTLCWTLNRGDPKVGDRIILWQAKGKGLDRGIIAIGQILIDPTIMSETEAERQFWRKPAPMEAARRTKFFVYRMSNLPLWERDHPDVLSNLAVARAHGGTVFSLEPGQWHAIMALAGVRQEPILPSVDLNLGQGYGLTPAERKVVERHAQKLAEDHFIRDGFEVCDVSKSKPFDLHCTRLREALRVEVKGTTGAGESVFLTRNEVEHARQFSTEMVLFIVSHINLDRSGDTPIANGGDIAIYRPWDVNQGELVAIQYEYRLPRSSK